MIKIRRAQVQKFANFSDAGLVYIKSHREENGLVIFRYVIPVRINQSSIGQLQGDLQVRGYSSQKRKPAINVKRSDVVSTNIIKKLDQQRIEQISSQKYIKNFFFKIYIDRPDLNREQIFLEIDIPERKIDNTFSLEIAAVRIDGSETIVDSAEIDHALSLKRYDLPSDNFYVTSTRDNNNRIFVTASTNDPVIGSFVFLIRKDSFSNFLVQKFLNEKTVPIDDSSGATAIFKVDDNDQSYTVRAYPVSKFLNQKVGNFKDSRLEYVKNVKQIPFYVSSLSDDSVTFQVSGVDQGIKKILIHRENLISGKKEFVSSFDNLSKNSFSLQDSGRIYQFPYVYSCDYIDETGEKIQSPSFALVPALKLDKLANISVTRVRNATAASNISQPVLGSQSLLTPGGANLIQFNASVSYGVESLYDQIFQDLKSLGLESVFSDDLEKMTNNLKPITRVLVSRISLITGETTEVGVFQPGIISVENPNQDESCIYRFEVAVRSAPESLEFLASGQQILANNAGNLKSNVDLVSKLIGNRSKTLSTNFSAKFLSKNSILDSTLKYGEALSLEDLSYYAGRTGIFDDVKIEVINPSLPIIKNINLQKTNRGNYITWSTSGNLTNITQFNIVADDRTFSSHPTKQGQQIFYVKDFSPKKISISYSGQGSQESKKEVISEIRNDN